MKIIFITIVVFACFLTSSIQNAIQDEKLINNFLGTDTKWFNVEPLKDNIKWPKELFNMKGNYVISKPLDSNLSTIGLFISGKVNFVPEMKEGRFFNEKDFLHNNKCAVIGEKFSKNIKNKNGKRYCLIENKEYEVIGVMKYRRKFDCTGFRCYVNLKSVTENINLLWANDFGIDAGNNTESVYSQLKQSIKNKGFKFKEV